jgi:DNA-binding NarL/FixJ family response regulator
MSKGQSGSVVDAQVRNQIYLRVIVAANFQGVDVSRTVALIDDDSFQRKRIRGALEREALTVVEHEPEDLSRQDLSGHAHDIFVVDLVMPVFDGIEVIRKVRGAGYPATIVAYSTDYPEYVPYATKLGADESLSISRDDGLQRLIETVRRYSSRGR